MFMVCGEALMDVFSVGETATGLALDARVGGSPFNVAVGLARLAQPVCLLTALSRDFAGDRLLRALLAEGVNTGALQRSDARTTLSLIGLDARGVPAYSFYGDGGADRMVGTEALFALPPGVRALHFGSYAAVVEPVASTQRALVERERGRALIAYDPNVRLNVEPDVARWRAQVDWMLPRSDLLKISDEDLGLLWPDTSPQAFADHALRRGVKLVVVTRGGAGALGWTAAAHASVPPVAVTVVDTVGAGDTFQAGLLTWLAEHDSLAPNAPGQLTQAQLHDLLGFAARAAAITCSRRGADMPRRAEVG
jgi:fructokinase